LQPDLESMRRCRVSYHDEANIDTVAAIRWLQNQAFVMKDRIAVSGASYGGIQTILAAEKNLGVRAYIPFTPAAMTWQNVETQKRLQTALEKTNMPVFLIQAEGDYSLGPYEVLGGYLNRKGGLNKAKLYPKFGNTEQEAHAVFAVSCEGIKVWGKDV